MGIFWTILIVIAIYFFIAFVALRFIAPFLGFGGFKPPRHVPEEIEAAIADLEIKATDKRTYLEAVFDLVMNKNYSQWNHTRFRAATRLPRMFVTNLSEIWETKDFIYCTSINYLVSALLVNSKYFKPEDIRVKHVFLNFVLHQYLQVNVGGVWVDVDPAGSGIRGKPLGSHQSFFG